jgi:predicted acetyltransferase
VPTHRRRGLLTSMMRRQLDDVRERGDLIAALVASEGAIYGRYGYGIGVLAARLRARRPAARLAKPQAAGGELRAGPAGEHVDAMRAIHERVWPHQPAMLDRPGAWWEYGLDDPERRRDGAQPLQAAIVDDGYALYAVRPEWGDEGPIGEVRIREIVTATPAARAQLWGFLIDQDLTTSITWEPAPVDDPLWLMIGDPRAVQVEVGDALWLRLVDVEGALRARTYTSDPAVVIDVTDAFCAWNAGRYRLAGGACERTDAAPDLALDVTDLAVAYLGGTTLRSLWRAGRVQELTPGAVARASAAFRGDVEPWSPDRF